MFGVLRGVSGATAVRVRVMWPQPRKKEPMAGRKKFLDNNGYPRYVYGRQELVHRAVMRRKMKRDFRPGEVVHHIDEDKTNYDPDNLELFPDNATHLRLRHGR